MRVFHNLPELHDVNLSIGSFDAIHIGHIKLIKKLLGFEGKRVILSFFPPPFIYFNREKGVTFLPHEKELILKNLNIDAVVFLPFDRAISLLKPEEFVNFLLSKIRLKTVVVGRNFRFGYKRKGNVELLSNLGERFGFHVISVTEERRNDEKISSSKIRELIRRGEIETANRFLFYPYFILGRIIKKTLKVKGLKLLPSSGVYRVKIEKREFTAYVKSGEIHIPDYSDEGEREVKFMKKI